jgi:carbamoyltransferase
MISKQPKQYILGINLPLKSRCHESGVALIDEEGEILFAQNEERLSRKKQDGDFPELSIKAMLDYTGVAPQEIKYVVVPTLNFWGKVWRFLEYLWRERRARIFVPKTYLKIFRILARGGRLRISKPRVNQEQEGPAPIRGAASGFVMRYHWKDFIKKNFPRAKIVFCDHHLAHAASAYFTSPWKDCLILTVDGAGNLLTSIVAEGRDGQIKIIDKTFLPHSAGTFWGSITKTCGFKSGTRHGGKVTGLAAYGKPEKLIEKMRQVIWVKGLRFRVKEEVFFDPLQLVPSWASYEPDRMKKFLGEATREEIAAAAQKRLEEVVLKLVKNARKAVPFDKAVLAGGTFANVLVNQKILELPEIKDVYVCPAMSDGGLALGAALYCLAELRQRSGQKFMPKALKSIFLGPSYSEAEIESYLKNVGAKYQKAESLAKSLGKLLHQGKIIALFNGRMEYGPRALGNRSILYAAADPKVNEWLNQRLRRSEFMPFAPVTLFEHIKGCYVGIADEPLAAKYMTITYQCTDGMKQQAPACVHLDGTARPQIIKKEDNPLYYEILLEYYQLSQVPTLINTSFNMHEEPIVCTPHDALRAFLMAELDYLALGPFLLSFQENHHLISKLLA